MTQPLLPPSKDLQPARRVGQVCDDPSHHRKGFVLKETQERQKKNKTKNRLGSPGRGGEVLVWVM